MARQDIMAQLVASLEDYRLDDGERRELAASLNEAELVKEDRAFLRNQVFKLSQQAIRDGAEPTAIVRWLERVIKAMDNASSAAQSVVAESWFSPGRSCKEGIIRQLNQCRKQADICVFTIADDDLSDLICKTHHRGVQVRVITDNEKLHDRGSDIDYLVKQGVAVKVDNTAYHMHHKFAVFDNQRLLNGSFNWTRSASKYNQEDITLTDDPRFVQAYHKRFNHLWQQFPVYAPNALA